MPIRVKVSAGRTKVEHDDAARVARRTGRPLREVVALAEQAVRLDSLDQAPGSQSSSSSSSDGPAEAAAVQPTPLHDPPRHDPGVHDHTHPDDPDDQPAG